MRRVSIAAAVTMVVAGSMAPTLSFAAQPVVTENLTGTIRGPDSTDTKGYFGAPGANLSGAKVSIYLQYVPTLFGPTYACRTHACTVSGSYNAPDTPGALLVTVTINGHRLVYSPTAEALIIASTQSPYQLTVDADANSGFGIGLPGIQLAALFTAPPVFGQPLSPGNQLSLQASSSDYLLFFNASSQTADEQLTYTPTGGTK